jgi:phosphoribosyl-AMP cyclohydrolase
METKELEDGCKIMLDFFKLSKYFAETTTEKVAGIYVVAKKNKQGIIPVVIQDWLTGKVLMLVYITLEVLRETLETGVVILWSTSRNEIWRKGETSGCVLKIKEVRVNCDQNSLLYLVEKPASVGACHAQDENDTFRETCFYRKIVDWANGKLTFI